MPKEDVRSLPRSEHLDVSAFSRVLDSATNSYKFLFLLALIDLLGNSNCSTGLLSFRSIAVQMLVRAWFPSSYCRLFFGSQDKVAEKLDELLGRDESEALGKGLSFGQQTIEKLASRIETEISTPKKGKSVDELMRYVPYRLLSSFFGLELRGLPDGRKDSEIRRLASDSYLERRPLYKFSSKDGTSVEIHPEWLEYLRQNWSIVIGWATWKWVEFLQSRNPNTPNIANKIAPPLVRGNLKQQHNYWDTVLRGATISCLYSGEDIILEHGYHLDHFLPWSFVAHDQLWNLAPVIGSMNEKKGNRIPKRKYLDELADRHFIAIREVKRASLSDKMVSRYLEEYQQGLRADSSELDTRGKVVAAYEKAVLPMLLAAEAQGFQGNWSPDL